MRCKALELRSLARLCCFRGSWCCYLDFNRHFIDIAGMPEIRARKRGSLGRVSSHRDPDQVAIPNNAFSRVKLDPAGPG